MRSLHRSSRHRLAVVLVALPAAMVAVPADAQTGLRVSPTRIEASVTDGRALPPIRVSNTGSAALVVDVTALPARQGLDGLPVYDTGAAARRAAWDHLEVSPQTLTIPPGTTQEVAATARGSARRPGQYGVVLFGLRPPAGKAAGPGAVATTVRFATNVLLRFPGPLLEAAVVAGARAEQGSEPRTLRFVTRLRNVGNIHVRVPARLVVRGASGKAVASERFPAEVVLPDAAREVPLVLRRVLPAGRYTAEVTSVVGEKRSAQEFSFTLVGPNLLPTADVAVTRLARPSPKPGRPYGVAVRVRNTGTAPVRPVARLRANRPGAGEEVGRRVVDLPLLAPGDEVDRTIEMPPVGHGQYELDLRLGDRGRVLDERRVGFEAGRSASWWDRLRDWLASHLEIVLVGAGLLIVLATAGGAHLGRRRRPPSPPPAVEPFEPLGPPPEPRETVGAGPPHS